MKITNCADALRRHHFEVETVRDTDEAFAVIKAAVETGTVNAAALEAARAGASGAASVGQPDRCRWLISPSASIHCGSSFRQGM